MPRICIALYSLRICLMNALITRTKAWCVAITDRASHCLIRDLARRNALRTMIEGDGGLIVDEFARIVCVLGSLGLVVIALYTLVSTWDGVPFFCRHWVE